jgi:hypothetical protein
MHQLTNGLRFIPFNQMQIMLCYARRFRISALTGLKAYSFVLLPAE